VVQGCAGLLPELCPGAIKRTPETGPVERFEQIIQCVYVEGS